VLIGLYLRWRPIYYLFMVDASLELLGSIVSIVLTNSYIFGVFGVVLSLARLLMIFQLDTDFSWEKRRILLRLDKNLKGGASYLIQGEKYAKRRMWGKAVIHLRRATALMPEGIGSRLALALACIRINRHDLAEKSIEDARHINATDPRIEEIASLLKETQSPPAQLEPTETPVPDSDA
jgi:hypothetical protein